MNINNLSTHPTENSRERGKFRSARQREGGGQAVSKIRRAAGMKTAIEDSKRRSIVMETKRLKKANQRRGADKTKSI